MIPNLLLFAITLVFGPFAFLSSTKLFDSNIRFIGFLTPNKYQVKFELFNHYIYMISMVYQVMFWSKYLLFNYLMSWI